VGCIADVDRRGEPGEGDGDMTFRTAAAMVASGSVLALVSCASGPANGFTKHKTFRMDPDNRPVAVDQSLPFEHKRLLYGAVTQAERQARKGNYYTFFWNVEDKSRPVELKFEYRQSATGFAVHTQRVEVPGKTRTVRFAVIGDEFKRNGSILGWKCTLLQGGVVLDEEKSFLWE